MIANRIFADFLYALWLFLPAGVANATPVLARYIPVLKGWRLPLDSSKSFRGKRIFGDNKTWRGLITGVILGGLTGTLQYLLVAVAAATSISLVVTVTWFGIAALMGLGALFGDAVESFFKRQLGIPPGGHWFPFDQIDYILGALILSYPFVRPSFQLLIITVITWFILHLVAVYLGYLIGVRDKPF